jgi:hypothetical protein
MQTAPLIEASHGSIRIIKGEVMKCEYGNNLMQIQLNPCVYL